MFLVTNSLFKGKIIHYIRYGAMVMAINSKKLVFCSQNKINNQFFKRSEPA